MVTSVRNEPFSPSLVQLPGMSDTMNCADTCGRYFVVHIFIDPFNADSHPDKIMVHTACSEEQLIFKLV